MLRNLVLGGLLIALVVAGAYVGCGPRGRVVKDKMIKEIDKVLGELNVKRAAVQIGYEKALAAKDTMLEKRIETQALRNRFEKDIKELETQRDDYKNDLKRLQPLLEEAKSAGADGTVGEKKIPVSTVTALATEQVKKLNRCKEKLDHKQRMFGVMEKNLSSLMANENATKKQLAKFKNDLEEIDAKKDLLDSMKTDASLVSEGVSLNDQFDKLSKDVDELMMKVDTKVAIEEAKLDERIADLETSSESSIDDILGSDNSDVDDLLSDIQGALGDDN
jgi:chromosome segregation ATPase